MEEYQHLILFQAHVFAFVQQILTINPDLLETFAKLQSPVKVLTMVHMIYLAKMADRHKELSVIVSAFALMGIMVIIVKMLPLAQQGQMEYNV
jgi:hypothetical protein